MLLLAALALALASDAVVTDSTAPVALGGEMLSPPLVLPEEGPCLTLDEGHWITVLHDGATQTVSGPLELCHDGLDSAPTAKKRSEHADYRLGGSAKDEIKEKPTLLPMPTARSAELEALEAQGKLRTGWDDGDDGGSFGAEGSGDRRTLVEAPIILGDMEREVAARALRPHLADLRFCYDVGLLDHALESAGDDAPALAGTVQLELHVEPDGTVSEAFLDSTLDDDGVESCLADLGTRLAFPARVGEGVVVVVYPFQFGDAEISSTEE